MAFTAFYTSVECGGLDRFLHCFPPSLHPLRGKAGKGIKNATDKNFREHVLETWFRSVKDLRKNVKICHKIWNASKLFKNK